MHFVYLCIMVFLLLIMLINRLMMPLPDWFIGTVGVIMMVDLMLVVFSTVRLILNRARGRES